MLISRIRQCLTSFGNGEVGAGLAEYMLLLMLIAMVILMAVVPIGTWIVNAFQAAVNMFP